MSDVIEQPIDERRNMPSASAFPRYDLCKGSFQMEQEARRLGQVAHIGGKDADRGTKIHAWLAGESVELEPDTLADAEALKARADEQEDRIFGEGTARNVLVERRLWFNTKKSSLSVSCRFDRTVYNDNTALTINFKTGWREPDPVRLNSQSRVEAVLVAMALAEAGIRPQRFIVQLVTIPFGVFETEFSWGELRDIYNWIVDMLVQLERPNAALTPHPDACNYCPALLICQAAKDLLAPITKTRASAISHDPRRIAESLDSIDVIRDYLDEFKAYCEAGLLANPPTLKITGYAMVPGAENRKFMDVAAAKSRMRELFIMDGSDRYSEVDKLKTHTPAAYQKIYAQNFNRDPKEVREAFDKLMDGLIETKQNKPSLKRVNGTATVKQLE